MEPTLSQFVVAGIVLGPSCLGWIEAGSDTKGFTILSELALTVILFNQASTLNLRTAFRRGHLPLRLMAIGIPVTFALNTATAVALLPALLSWEAVCLAVIVAPTEVALLDALLEDRRIPERVRHALSIESGLYDGFASTTTWSMPSSPSRPESTRCGWNSHTTAADWPRATTSRCTTTANASAKAASNAHSR
jgi:NhaP-type Na+/H+ or K+/H+ antiporter